MRRRRWSPMLLLFPLGLSQPPLLSMSAVIQHRHRMMVGWPVRKDWFSICW
ncbi:hypothetical protein E2C01_038393 [Portunus trituberculatus]|uniref:Uncharacterized protein n=1 Tax=Portunus trituberculatus TaxID=210409 RepID=A0A5B7FK23_PORTR|nr:hypothetical protein [Portunus trituberculatus]